MCMQSIPGPIFKGLESRLGWDGKYNYTLLVCEALAQLSVCVWGWGVTQRLYNLLQMYYVPTVLVWGGGGEEYGTRGNTAKDFGSTLNFRN